MGGTVVSSEGGVGGGVMELGHQKTERLELLPAAEQMKTEEVDGPAPADVVAEAKVRSERFLPKMVLRVLLVESDDSTRQIIAALLRKCNYKVAAVGDGLKAWEVLKKRPRNVDLILTEVDLPAISGYALLTLIMEDEVCKTIPVIMMSAKDSISTVYKCMLRGAVDFLVKPLRKNELKNLWQHVWRRQISSRSGHGQGEESVVQLKVEATAENDALSNHSSGFQGCIEKGSDAQSSSTKPDVPESHPIASDCQLREGEGDKSSYEAKMASSKQTMSLIRSFDNQMKVSYVSGSNASENDKVASSSPPLELSLKRYPSCSVNQFPDEKHRLKHSDASAFTRYVSKGQRPSEIPVSNSVRFEGLSNNSYVFMASSSQQNLFSCLNDQTMNCPMKPATEYKMEESGNSQKMLRQAALNKFRAKRKERCFEKKVRYESRKKLAEQRPRVKGQFVRREQEQAG